MPTAIPQSADIELRHSEPGGPFEQLPFSASTVPVFERSSIANFIDEYRPVVARGWLDSWRLFRELQALPNVEDQLSFLRALAPDREVSYTELPPGGRMGYVPGTLEPSFDCDDVTSPFAPFVDQLRGFVRGQRAQTLYLQSLPLASHFPEVLSLLVDPPGEGLELKSARMWLGSGTHVTQLHYDAMSNHACVLVGTKRVLLFPPACLPDLYPAPPDRGLVRAPCSLADPLRPDLRTFPLLARALPCALSVVLHPGDILHIPPYWWHQVESSGLNLMINFWQPKYGRLRTVIARSLEDLLLARQELPPEGRMLFHELVVREIDLLLGDGQSSRRRLTATAGVVVPGPAIIRIAQFVDTLALCPRYWQQLYAGFARHYTDPDPFPTLPGECMAFAERIQARRVSGDELLCF